MMKVCGADYNRQYEISSRNLQDLDSVTSHMLSIMISDIHIVEMSSIVSEAAGHIRLSLFELLKKNLPAKTQEW